MKLNNVNAQYNDFLNFLNENLHEKYEVHTISSLIAWMNEADENGYIELAGIYTKTGTSVTGQFDELKW